jgi:phospholipid transport system transporter-binding protein
VNQISPQSDGGFSISGELVFDTVPDLVANGRTMFAADGGTLAVDLAHVSRADSAGLALLIEWRRMAVQRGKTIVFKNVPAQMIAIAKVSGLDALLGLQAREA